MTQRERDAREKKAGRIADHLRQNRITAEECRTGMKPGDWIAIAIRLGFVWPPSDLTKARVIELLEESAVGAEKGGEV